MLKYLTSTINWLPDTELSAMDTSTDVAKPHLQTEAGKIKWLFQTEFYTVFNYMPDVCLFVITCMYSYM